MPNWTERDLERQFARSRDSGWIPFFQRAGSDYEFPAHILMGIASRETNMRSIIGDGGHGYGIMQIDDRSYPDWCNSGQWKDVNACIQKGALVLDEKRETIRSGQGSRLRVGDKTFVGKPGLTAGELLQTAVAAYNSGLWAYYSLTTFGDPDRRTTGRDYSVDTLTRAEIFRRLLRRG